MQAPLDCAKRAAARLENATPWMMLALPFWPLFSFIDHNKGEDRFEIVSVIATVTASVGFVAAVALLVVAIFGRRTGERILAAMCVLLTAGQLYGSIKALLRTAGLDDLGVEPLASLGLWAAFSGAATAAAWIFARSVTGRRFLGAFSAIVMLLPLWSLAQSRGNLDLSQQISTALSSFDWEKVTPVPFEMVKPNGTNVYVFIFDAYLRPDMMEAELHFSDPAWEEHLRRAGFRIGTDTWSNFSTTYWSLNYMLNPQLAKDNKDLLARIRKTENSFVGGDVSGVQRWFEARGYDFVMLPHHGEDRAACHPNCITTDPLISFSTVQYLKITPIYDVVANYVPGLLWDWLSSIPQRPDFALDNFPAAARSPFAMVAHVLLPHPPYSRLPDCSRRTFEPVNYEYEGDPEDRGQVRAHYANLRRRYLDQVACADRQMMAIADRIRTVDPSAIVVFLSDHGWKSGYSYRNSLPRRFSIRMRHANLFAVKMPRNCVSPDGLTVVDVFPLIQSCLTGTPFAHTAGRLFEIEDEQLRDVTDAIRGPMPFADSGAEGEN